MNVLYVIDNLSFGGGERGFAQLSAHIDRERFQPHVAAGPGGELEKRTAQADVPFFSVDMGRQTSLKPVARISKLIRDNDIRIVHSMGARADFFARLACRKTPSVALVCTTAMPVAGFDVCPFRKVLYKALDRWSSRYVTHFIAVSQALKGQLISDYRISADKVSVIHNGVELDKYDPDISSREEALRAFGLSPDNVVVGTIGRLVYQKGYSYFLEAAKRVCEKNTHARFVIVGEGDEESRLKALTESLGISRICIFAGQRFDIAGVLPAFDVFVLSSLLEGLPRTVIEAMAMARPIVATDIQGVREELIHNESGLLVPPADPKALSEAILDLLDDRKKAQRLGNEARKTAERLFDIKRTISEVQNLYDRLLQQTS